MKIYSKHLILVLSIIIASCNYYDIEKFDIQIGQNKYKGSITLFNNDDMEIDANGVYASYPNKHYEFGVNTEVRFWNQSNKTITIDSIKVLHFHNNINISDSIRIEGNVTLPYSLRKRPEERYVSLFSITFHVDNSQTNFKVGDEIQVFSDIWFKISNEPFHVTKNFIKKYRRLRGLVMP